VVAPLLGTVLVGLLTNLAWPMKLSRGIRLVALFEGPKGALILLAGLGLLALAHRDLQDFADELVRRFHLKHARHYPRIFIEASGKTTDTRLWLLAGAALLYAAFRVVEAYGLWRERRWAGWFAAATGAIYVPLEVVALLRSITWVKLTTLTVNLGIVAFMTWTLWRSRGESSQTLDPIVSTS
jgi:uncharacterized membrane protein (DUF2068 family)